MPDQYIDVPIEFDETTLYNTGVARIQEYFPTWTPKPLSMIDLVLRTCAMYAAVGAEVASDVPFNIFRAFGTLAQKPPINATPATVDSTWTVQDLAGYTIPAQTPVGLVPSSNLDQQPEGFIVPADTPIAPGNSTVNITLVAAEPGAAGSNLDTVVRTDSLAFVTNIALSGVSTGGVDAELDVDYVDRLAQEFEVWTTTPIKGRDFAIVARQIAGVFRCGYWENYNPADGTTNNDKTVTLCPLDVNGNDTSSDTRTSIAQLMESLREINFICNVIASTRSTIDISYTAHVTDPTTITPTQTNIATALVNFINPATWGAPASGQVPIWVNTPVLRLSQVMTAIETAGGVAYAENLEMAIHPNALAAADINLPGAFPLPVLGTVTANVVSP